MCDSGDSCLSSYGPACFQYCRRELRGLLILCHTYWRRESDKENSEKFSCGRVGAVGVWGRGGMAGIRRGGRLHRDVKRSLSADSPDGSGKAVVKISERCAYAQPRNQSLTVNLPDSPERIDLRVQIVTRLAARRGEVCQKRLLDASADARRGASPFPASFPPRPNSPSSELSPSPGIPTALLPLHLPNSRNIMN